MLCCEDSETLEKVAQGSSGCPISSNVQDCLDGV